MLALKEVTEWNVEYKQPNHTYLVDGDKILAYKQWHAGEPIYSKTPVRLNKRYRKFVEVDIAQFGQVCGPVRNIKKVQGSKGNVYTVDLDAKTCSCEGYKWRGKCKHVEA
jgi:hypothetical protein